MRVLLLACLISHSYAATSDGKIYGTTIKDETLCAFVHVHNGVPKRFWRIYQTSDLILQLGANKCPRDAEPTAQELENLKSALPYRR
jgi:hypothetical protein